MKVELEGLAADSGDANGDDEHDPEGSTLAYERAQVAALLAEAECNLGDLDTASARLKAGTYSVCEACGEKIALERLEALPAARRCIGCASAPLPR
ncbi:MAG: TraR/DksA C4-type zinc finger protein [Acidimicrobiales bacterium]|jgi:RNA polymerase-binding transcription factor DksA